MERCCDLAPVELLPGATDKPEKRAYADVARLPASKFERASFFERKLRARHYHGLM